MPQKYFGRYRLYACSLPYMVTDIELKIFAFI